MRTKSVSSGGCAHIFPRTLHRIRWVLVTRNLQCIKTSSVSESSTPLRDIHLKPLVESSYQDNCGNVPHLTPIKHNQHAKLRWFTLQNVASSCQSIH